MSNRHNLILNTDSYKASHFLQYPPQTTRISSYIESRGGDFSHVLFFGLQAFLKQYLCQPINQADIDEADVILKSHGLPFNRNDWQYILDQYQGYLPLAIESVAEGTLLPTSQVLLQVINTDPRCYWLTSYVETALLRAIWYPSTVATLSWHCKRIMRDYLIKTANDLSHLPFMLHDFGSRGVSSHESAALGGLAHLVNFQGTDTLAAIVAAKQYYQTDMAGYSIPAAEHSTVTSWGRNFENQAYNNMIKQFANNKDSMFAVVSDSYNLWHALENIWGDELKSQVIDNPGVLVIRPDSGDPIDIVTKTIQQLMSTFGSTVNNKGYHVLPNNIRVIQGDGVDIKAIDACLQAMKAAGQSADNISFGMGGALLQKVNRDTLKFAMKADAIERGGQWHDVYKSPVTDPTKSSKRGRLALVRDREGDFKTIRLDDLATKQNYLLPTFHSGQLCQEWDLTTIRERADSYWSK